MSIKIMTWVWEDGPKDPTERFLLLAMADIADEAGLCWPSVARLADRCCMSERNARRIIRKLEDAGWVLTFIQPGRNQTNHYRITKPDIAVSARTDCPPGQIVHENRTNEARKPDIAVSPEPPVTTIEPPIEAAPRSRRRPEVPIPANWIPSDKNLADAHDRQFSAQEIQDEADRFRNHHLARDTRFRDWDAAWRTWLANSRKFARGGMAGKAAPGGRGSGRSLASIVAERRLGGSHG